MKDKNNMVFCKHCKYLKRLTTSGDLKGYDYVIYKDKYNNLKLSSWANVCVHDPKIKEHIIFAPYEKRIRKDIYVDNHWILNENNDCKFYKEKLIIKIFKPLIKLIFG